jgi:hypothetical protein
LDASNSNQVFTKFLHRPANEASYIVARAEALKKLILADEELSVCLYQFVGQSFFREKSQWNVTRRAMLAATAPGGVLTLAASASAQTSEAIPQPQHDGRGGTDPGPRNVVRDRQNPDLLNPPSTDAGTLPNLRFSFADAHVRQESGGWARQVTVREFGISREMAGVNMRLNAGGIRELHWHKAAEWAYMLYGTARITAIDPQGHYFVDDVSIGDLWCFRQVSRIRSRG